MAWFVLGGWTALALAQPGASEFPRVSPPRSPAESARAFRLADGFRIDLVASEPSIASPVAMAFDERGRMWVVEMPDYPVGPDAGQKPEGRIKILEDRDRDGVFESASVFAGGLLFANGVLPWKNGAIVTAAPHVLFLEDADGDGRADRRTVWFDGFATENPQLRVSHPVFGPDQKVYVANGLRGGKIRHALHPEIPPIDLSGMDFRFDPWTVRGEPISGMGQFGNAFDDWGNRFVCDNRHHLRQIVLERRYLENNPYQSAPGVLEDISDAERESRDGAGPPVFPLTTGWTTSNLHANRFTAACSVFIARTGALGPGFEHAAFVCEPTGNLVRMERLRPNGAVFRSTPYLPDREFLASTDEWFRPVFLQTHADGGLYIVDMCRAIVEHPEWMPPELRSWPALHWGKDRGRIWRVSRADSERIAPLPALNPENFDGNAALLDDPNAWIRSTAARLLDQRRDEPAVEVVVRRRFHQAKSDAGQFVAASLLSCWGKLTEDEAIALLDHGNPRLREMGLRLAEPLLPGSERLSAAVAERAADDDARVRFQAALSVGSLPVDRRLTALAAVGRRDANDRWTRAAVIAGAPDAPGRLALRLLAEGGIAPEHALLLEELASVAGSRQDADEILGLLAAALDDGKPWSPKTRLALTAGLAKGVGRRGGNIAAFLKDGGKLAVAWQGFLRETAFSELSGDGTTDRLRAIELLSYAEDDRSIEALASTVIASEPMEVRFAAVRSLCAGDSRRFHRLLDGWSASAPSLRRAVAEAALGRPERVAALLDRVETGGIRPADLGTDVARRLRNHRDPAISSRAAKWMPAPASADRAKVLADYRQSLSLPGDANRGREIFRKHCATCHAIGGVGVRVGPDISDTRTKTAEMLLRDILDPSAAIDANYVAYQVVTKSGETLTGMIAAETPASLRLVRAENQSVDVLRSEIEELQSSGKSLMPDGLEKEISLAEMADLLAFLKKWRILVQSDKDSR